MTVVIPTLLTDRLSLRMPRMEDAGPMADYLVSDRSKTVGGPFPAGDAFTRLCAMIGHWQLRGFGRWIIADRTTDEALGVTGLFQPEGWPEPELAWTVFNTAEGRGIAFEAAQAARDYAYDALGWATLISAVDPANTRSVALAERMGCWADGTFDHATYGTLHIWRHPKPEAM